jgi:hypothetical protein
MRRQRRKKVADRRAVDGHDFEIERHIEALGESASKVRFVMLAIIIAATASVATWWSARPDSWEKSRLSTFAENYSLANRCGLWTEEPLDQDTWQQPENPSISQDYKYLFCPSNVIKWAKLYGITDKKAAEEFGNKEREAFINNVLYIKVPILGPTFDINDLGLIAGVAFFLLMLVMVFYTHRGHENLALCMWKVRHIADSQECFDQPGSRANLLYHAIAMRQVFTVPPTLARWKDIFILRRAHYLLLALPIVVQARILRTDWMTKEVGAFFSQPQTAHSLLAQIILMALVAVLSGICFAHFLADDLLWDKMFYTINPAHRYKKKARWLHWMKLIDSRAPGWGILIKGDEIYFCDSVFGSVWKVAKDSPGQKMPRYRRCIAFLKSLFEPNKGAILSREKGLIGRGLYLGTDGEIRAHCVSATDRLEGGEIRETEFQKPLSDDGCEQFPCFFPGAVELQVLKRKMLRRPLKLGANEDEKVGGAESQKDGINELAGFDTIRAVLSIGGDVFLSDGAWVRKVNAAGQVETWGGKPLAKVKRRERPFILGMTLEPQQDKQGVDPTKLIVCDFSRKRLLKVSRIDTHEMYRSWNGWAPSGIALQPQVTDGTDTFTGSAYLLEYRQGFWWNEVISFIQRRGPRYLAWAFRWRHYLRIRKIDYPSFRKDRVIIKVSPAKAKAAAKSQK